jgi:hypothetical protein
LEDTGGGLSSERRPSDDDLAKTCANCTTWIGMVAARCGAAGVSSPVYAVASALPRNAKKRIML